MDRNLIPRPLVAALPALEGDDDLDARRCDRCRRVFEDGPTLDIQGGKDASLCPRCEAIPPPRRSRSTAVLTLVPPLEDDESHAHQSRSGGE